MTVPAASPVPEAAHRLVDDAVTSDMSTIPAPAAHSPEAARLPDGESSGGVPVLTVVLFMLGCVLLVFAAANLANLGAWSDRWGVIPVFLVFFLVMSVAGRWFWTGADAILGALKWGKAK